MRQVTNSVVQAALTAFRRGDRSTAARILNEADEKLLDAEAGWLVAGQIYEALNDEAAADASYLRHTDGHPRDVAGLLLLGDLRRRRGDERAANVYYRTALASAASGAAVPAGLSPRLEEARLFVAELTSRFSKHLNEIVAPLAVRQVGGSTRLSDAVDLLFGRTTLYQQQPSMFYFPELPQRAFFDRSEFPWLSSIEQAVPVMIKELQAVLAELDFSPYVQRLDGQPAPNNPLLNDDRWGAKYLWHNGEQVLEMLDRCPETMRVLELAPMPRIAKRSPMALFSLLKPGTHIQPHTGLLNTRLIVHVPLLVPEGCGIRVGAHTREWRVGEALIFDDSIEHEAWNKGADTRVVLLFEIWRPELTNTETAALTKIFEAIDEYQNEAIELG